jgi:hypothetical protein
VFELDVFSKPYFTEYNYPMTMGYGHPEMCGRKIQFAHLYQKVPAMSFMYPFDWENRFSPCSFQPWMEQHFDVAWAAVIIYMVAVFGVQHLLKDRKPFDLKMKLAGWNLFLSLFSFCGVIRTVPQLLANLYVDGFEYTICEKAIVSYGSGATGLWAVLFVLSKLPELVDTAFIVLRKKPLIFLHWYHHVTVLLFCWHSYSVAAGNALYFIAMNYSVHAIMYGYYFLMAIGRKPKWLPPVFITLCQISQMFVGVGICISAFLYSRNNPDCAVTSDNLFYGALMYASYFALFVHFAVQRFVFKVDVAARMKGQKEKKMA